MIDETLATDGTGNDATPNTNGIMTQVRFAWHVSRLIIFTHFVCSHYDKSNSLSPRSLLFKRPPRLWQRMKKGIVLCPTSRESRHRFVLPDILVLYLSLLILCVFIMTNPFHTALWACFSRVRTSADASRWKCLVIFIEHRQDSGKGLFEVLFSSLHNFYVSHLCFLCEISYFSLLMKTYPGSHESLNNSPPTTSCNRHGSPNSRAKGSTSSKEVCSTQH